MGSGVEAEATIVPGVFTGTKGKRCMKTILSERSHRKRMEKVHERRRCLNNPRLTIFYYGGEKRKELLSCMETDREKGSQCWFATKERALSII